jgi:hypothetical protein
VIEGLDENGLYDYVRRSNLRTLPLSAVRQYVIQMRPTIFGSPFLEGGRAHSKKGIDYGDSDGAGEALCYPG